MTGSVPISRQNQGPMETGREHEVIAAFVRWLEVDGWLVRTEHEFADVVAERGEERLVAEAKGVTTSPGLDVDTLYGQLLRRMVEPRARYAVVVPEKVVTAAQRVPEWVRTSLGIELYGVDMDDTIRRH